VVAAGGDEEGRAVVHGDVEAEHVHVEAASGGDVSHLQVDVADLRRTRGPGAEVPGEELVGVERQGGGLEGAGGVVGPLVAGAVPVEFEAVALRVGEVERLGEEVVRAAGERAGCEPGHRHQGGGQRGTVREEDRGVVEPRRAGRGGREVRDLAQDDGGFPSTQHHGGAVGVDDVEADAVVVVAGHGVEVTYEEFDGAHRGGGGEAAVLGHEVPSGVDSRVGAGS